MLTFGSKISMATYVLAYTSWAMEVRDFVVPLVTGNLAVS
jgi:hypothetical protein